MILEKWVVEGFCCFVSVFVVRWECDFILLVFRCLCRSDSIGFKKRCGFLNFKCWVIKVRNNLCVSKLSWIVNCVFFFIFWFFSCFGFVILVLVSGKGKGVKLFGCFFIRFVLSGFLRFGSSFGLSSMNYFSCYGGFRFY